MSYEIRSLATLQAQAKQFFVESIPGAVVDLWANTWRVLQKVLALIGFEHELRRAWLFDQIFASRADKAWLLRHGYELGILPKIASRATGTATIATAGGLLIPAGLVFRRADGALFRVRASEIASGTLTDVSFEAVEPGAAGNTTSGATLTLVDSESAPAGLGGTAIVTAAGLGGGADDEDVEAFRQRVLDRKRLPPQGGSKADWIRWAKEVPGVRAVYVTGYVDTDRFVWLTFLMDGRVNGIPTAGDVAVLQAYLDDDVRRPITARVKVVAPVPQVVNVQIQGLAPDTQPVRAAIQAELAALFAERMEPALPGKSFTLPRAWISEAISRATGEDRHTLVLPAENLIFDTPGALPVLGAVTY